ncbi:DEAD/DEAH box helicase [Infirmifilum sp. NZ]|uniref:DEAD/DEAH box helicase n=1 Tax=Infirmifilum sp. NZ TaxID=2926850 RepID=UPI0027A93294|nr:DEAD/DEAH box helicase [Infirmifilum sp. NZ]UNQ72512.1 DEAD/DEAH box helicase [Infirmifilum sp. NZ]
MSAQLDLLLEYFPQSIVETLVKRLGLTQLYPTQVEAIKSGVLDGQDIVLSAPTASGKTLVAELAMLKALTKGGKALYMAPLRALASEKYDEFSTFFGAFGYKTAISTGDFDSDDPWLEKYDVIVTTNEKADSLLRHKAKWFDRLTLIVADEIHLLGSDRRGATLEVFLTRVKLMPRKPQLLGLSATIGNLEELAEWLQAKPVRVDWRPVPLKEGVYYNGEVFYSDGSSVSLEDRGSPLYDLAHDTLRDEGQMLVFSPTRRSAVSDAKKLAAVTLKFMKPQESRAVRDVIAKLKSIYADKVTLELLALLPRGVAFHHAGLGSEARSVVEKLFRDRLIKVVVATPTLAAGVNLPARRVVITDYRRFNVEMGYYEKIPVMEYKQMAGRAGRPRYDEEGEAILIARSLQELEFLFNEYINAKPERLQSQLSSEPILRSHILSIIATSDQVRNISQLERFLTSSFYSHQNKDYFYIVERAKLVLKRLASAGFLEINGENIVPTQLGIRVAELYIDPLTAVQGLEFFKARESASAIAYLFLISRTPDAQTVHVRRGDEEWLEEKLKAKAGELGFETPDDEVEYEFFLQQFKTALLLEDWINEVPEDVIVDRYDVGPGDIYSITLTAQWIAFALAEIARLSGYSAHSVNLGVLSKRIEHGVKEELLELVSLKGIGRVRARSLYSHGYRSLIDLVAASEEQLARVPGIGKALAKAIKKQLSADEEVEVPHERTLSGLDLYLD